MITITILLVICKNSFRKVKPVAATIARHVSWDNLSLSRHESYYPGLSDHTPLDLTCRCSQQQAVRIELNIWRWRQCLLACSTVSQESFPGGMKSRDCNAHLASRILAWIHSMVLFHNVTQDVLTSSLVLQSMQVRHEFRLLHHESCLPIVVQTERLQHFPVDQGSIKVIRAY